MSTTNLKISMTRLKSSTTRRLRNAALDQARQTGGPFACSMWPLITFLLIPCIIVNYKKK